MSPDKGEMIPVADVLAMAKVKSLDELANRESAFRGQRHQIRELQEELTEARRELETVKYSGDPETAKLQRTIASLEKRIDQLQMQDLDNETVEEIFAKYPWVRNLPKVERIQAVKDLVASQRAVTNAAPSPERVGRSKSEAAAQAHLTGGGPPASSRAGDDDEERELAEYKRKMAAAKTQKERNDLADEWGKKHDERPL